MDDPRYIVVTKNAPNFFDRLYFAVIDTHNGNRIVDSSPDQHVAIECCAKLNRGRPQE